MSSKLVRKAGQQWRGKTDAERRGFAAYLKIQPGDRVTIVSPHGQEHSGRAVMRGPYGWVLNMGGRYGTPGIASPDNVVRVSKAKAKKPTGVKRTSTLAGYAYQYVGARSVDPVGAPEAHWRLVEIGAMPCRFLGKRKLHGVDVYVMQCDEHVFAQTAASLR